MPQVTVNMSHLEAAYLEALREPIGTERRGRMEPALIELREAIAADHDISCSSVQLLFEHFASSDA